MPPARKSSRSSSRRSSTFKEPAAVKRLSRSLEAAQKAVGELRSHAGRDAGAATRSLHQDLRKFISDATRDSRKLTTQLKRDFDRAQKTAQRTLAQSSQSGGRSQSGRRSTSGRSSTSSGRRSSGSRGGRGGRKSS
jgi:hypothetical protein